MQDSIIFPFYLYWSLLSNRLLLKRVRVNWCPVYDRSSFKGLKSEIKIKIFLHLLPYKREKLSSPLPKFYFLSRYLWILVTSFILYFWLKQKRESSISRFDLLYSHRRLIEKLIYPVGGMIILCTSCLGPTRLLKICVSADLHGKERSRCCYVVCLTLELTKSHLLSVRTLFFFFFFSFRFS